MKNSFIFICKKCINCNTLFVLSEVQCVRACAKCNKKFETKLCEKASQPLQLLENTERVQAKQKLHWINNFALNNACYTNRTRKACRSHKRSVCEFETCTWIEQSKKCTYRSQLTTWFSSFDQRTNNPSTNERLYRKTLTPTIRCASRGVRFSTAGKDFVALCGELCQSGTYHALFP